MCGPEIGAPVYRIIGFLNYDEIEHGLRSDLSAGKRADEVHRCHPELGHLVNEALQFCFEHLATLNAEAEHHRHREAPVRMVSIKLCTTRAL